MANPYANGGGFTADEYNGLHGAYSPDAILAEALTRGNSGGPAKDPWTAALEHATDFKPPTLTPPRVTNALVPGQDTPVTPPPGTFGLDPGFHPNTTPVTPPPVTAIPPVTITPPPATTPTGRNRGASSGSGVTGGAAAGAPPKPPQVDDAVWGEANRWVTDARKTYGDGYDYLLQKPELVGQFRAWQQANGAQSVDPVDWLKHNGYPSPGAGRNGGKDTFLEWYKGAHAGQPGTPSGTPTTPPLPTVPPIPGVGAPPTPPPTGTGSPLQPSADYLANLNRALDASQANERANALRGFRSGAAATGMENSGAYVSGQGQIATDLAARFGEQKAQLLNAASEAERGRQFTGSQNELDRTMTQYGLDLNAYTSRFNTSTQAGVQQMANAIQYDLGLRGIQIDQSKLEEMVRNNTLNYNLGVGQQDLSRYGIDQGTQTELYKLMQSIGPEQLFHLLFGTQSPPTTIPYTP